MAKEVNARLFFSATWSKLSNFRCLIFHFQNLRPCCNQSLPNGWAVTTEEPSEL